LYVSGEESQKQIKMRAERITPSGDNLHPNRNKTQNIFKQIIEPEIVIIDSIQTLHTDYIESRKHITNSGNNSRIDQIC
jgi:DNA repair protein RadA/Sms